VTSASARFHLLATALLFSTGGAVIKATSLSSWQVAGFRSGVAALTILLLIASARRNWSKRVFLVGLAYAATLILFVTANKLTTAANAVFLQSPAPLYLVLLGPLLLKEKAQRIDWIMLPVVAVGMSLFYLGGEAASATAPNPVLGNLLGTASGVTWALTLTGLRWIARREQDAGMATVAAGNLLAFLFCLPKALPLTNALPEDWMAVIYLGVVQIGLAYVLLTRGMSGVPAMEASLLLMLEPALNPVWAWMVHGETPGPYALAGGAIILLTTVARAAGLTSSPP
jgi:drug/metabolite transporter (DMT)-like permease